MSINVQKLPILFVVLGALLVACSPVGSRAVRVATDATWPPFENIDEDTKELVGFDIDLMNAIADKADIKIEFINVSFDTLLAGMTQCQYDAAISAITITADRAADYSFSSPYFAAGQILVVQVVNNDINSHNDMRGKVVGVQKDTTGDVEAQKIEGALIQRYDDIELAFLDLMNAQIDAVIADNPLALSIVGKYPDRLKTVGDIFTEENYGIAVCKNNADLVKRINVALSELRAEGYIEKLTQIWIVGNNP